MDSAIILDLDATLVDTFGSQRDWHLAIQELSKRKNDRIFQINADGLFLWGTKRPYTDTFLKSCFENADVVGVWSAGSKEYVDEVVQELFVSAPRSPDFVWSKEDCTPTLCKDKIVKQKPLSKFWSAHPHVDPNRTIIFDDAKRVCAQHPRNHIMVKPWEGGVETLQKEDDTLRVLTTWISENMSRSKDITTIPVRSYLDGR